MPNMNYWHKSADFKINIRTNSKGIRADEEITYEKPPGVKRIVVLGDSFGMGYEVNLEDSFLEKMKEYLVKAGKNVQIINLSVSGHGNAEQLIMLKNEGVKYLPDMVLLCWHGGTDLDDNPRSNLYILENGILKRNAEIYLPGIKISDRLYKIPLFIPISENSHIYNWARDEAGRKIKILFSEFRNLQTKFAVKRPKAESNVKNRDDYSEKLTIVLLKKMEEECKKINSKFVVFDIPNQKERFKFYSVFPKKNNNFPIEYIVSPIEIFHKNIVKSELLINERSHFHFTPKACRLAGQVLSEYIINNNLL